MTDIEMFMGAQHRIGLWHHVTSLWLIIGHSFQPITFGAEWEIVLGAVLSHYILVWTNPPTVQEVGGGRACSNLQAWISLCHERITTQSSTHLSTEMTSSLLLMIFLGLSFSSTCVRNSLFEFFVEHCFKCFVNWWLEIYWFLHTAQVAWQESIAFSKQILGEQSSAHLEE